MTTGAKKERRVLILRQIIQSLCATKETMSLKALSSALSRRHQALDVLLLFHTTFSILQPLCQLLDNWRYDADQGMIHQHPCWTYAHILTRRVPACL